MSDQTPNESSRQGTSPPSHAPTPDEIAAYRAERRRQQRFAAALAAAVAVAAPVLVAWVTIFRFVGFDTARPEIWFVSAWGAVFLGLAVGYPFRRVGRGIDDNFAIAAALVAFVAAMLGDFFTVVHGREQVTLENLGMFASHRGVGDLILYCVAGYFATRVARERLTDERIAALLRPPTPQDAGGGRAASEGNEGSPNLRIHLDRPGFFLVDGRLTARVDGRVVYEGSFTAGFDVAVAVEPGPHILVVDLNMGSFRRERRYELTAPATGYRGGCLEARLRYSRFWGNFAKVLELRTVGGVLA